MEEVTPLVAQYGSLWASAVVSAGKNDCNTPLVLLKNMKYYNSLLTKTNRTDKEEQYIKDNKSLYDNLKKPKVWRLLSDREKMVFCVDYLYGVTTKMPYIVNNHSKRDNLLDTSVKTYDFGSYIIKCNDSSGNPSDLRSLASLDCISFTALLDLDVISRIQKHKGNQADYVRRTVFNKAIQKMEKAFNRKIPYILVVEDNKRTTGLLHLHGIIGVTAEELSQKDVKSKRTIVENAILSACLGKDYNRHSLINSALDLKIVYHPLGWAHYITKNDLSRNSIYISRKVIEEGEKLYEDYRNAVIDLKETQKDLTKVNNVLGKS